jgi:hypothetical protein
MDVSRSEAQRAQTNAIARSDDNGCRRFAQVVARSSLRAITFAQKLRCAPFGAHIHRPYSRRYRVGCEVDDTKASVAKSTT